MNVFAEDLFASAERQVENLCSWEYVDPGLLEALTEKGLPMPGPEDRTVALTLCWTLDTLVHTVAAKLDLMRAIYGPDKVIVPERLEHLHDDFLAIIEDAPSFTPYRVWWERVDIGSTREIPLERVSLARAAGTQVLDLACQHPAYIRRQDGHEIPYLTAPALRIHFPGYMWTMCLCIRGHRNGYVGANLYSHANGDSKYSHAVTLNRSKKIGDRLGSQSDAEVQIAKRIRATHGEPGLTESRISPRHVSRRRKNTTSDKPN